MKYLGLLFIFTSLNSYSAPSAEVYMDSLKESNPQLAKALQIDGVYDIYQGCMKKHSANGVVDGKSLMDCVWDDVQLKPDLKDAVTDSLKSDISETSKDGVASSRYQEKSSLNSTKREKSSALQALEKYLQKQLEDALYGERIANSEKLHQRERAADQKVFFVLFESQLGKNVINILSSYCIESQMMNDKYFFIPKSRIEQEKVRTTNLQGLASIKTDSQGNQILASAATWNDCVATIQHHCYQTEDIKEMDKDGVLKSTGVSYSKTKMLEVCQKNDLNYKPNNTNSIAKFRGENCTEAIDYTVQRACEVTDYISRARKSLDATGKLISKMGNIDLGRDPTSVSSYNEKNAEKKIDELTSLTSNQMVESGALEAAKDEAAEFETCFKDGKVQDPEACKSFLQTNREEKLQELAEYKINSEVSIEEIEKLTIDDEEKIQKILMEDGYSEDDAKNLATNQDILKEIKSRYKSKEEALQRSVIDQVNKITSQKNDEITDLDATALTKIGEELKSKTQDFAKLVHYNNIVSSYLTITSDDKENGKVTRQNTAMLQRELASNAFNDKNLKSANEVDSDFQGSGIQYDNLDRAIEATGVSLDAGNDETADSPTVKSEDIVKSILGLFRTKE
ncbi:hypothetical protein [Bacteriovorax sp. Seq25_V]|uniref:hypothetical protein n=1 Tax=Bacteriovorax sp. Seq25_V TaxID=1201288 RepID=UPI00038A3A8B|nr:hypothetical protein [Bacteriovorax sp. Seq25_V]EQC44371.1 hypothetical protein M900_A0467 [Bacteriovorax sp. Seq25_V]